MTDRKVVWITGAGSGIGRAAAILLARDGHHLVLTGRRPDALEETAAQARRSAPTAEIAVMPADFTKAPALAAVVDETLKRFGRLDVVVGAAGNNLTDRMWSQLKPEQMDYLLDGNLRGQIYTAAAALPAMRAQKDGLFVFVGSQAGVGVGLVSGPMYTTAKHGLTAMSHTLNVEECVNGIRACCVCPGEVDTPMLAKRPKKLTAEELAKILKAEDVAEVIAFVVRTPAHVCLNQIWVTPTFNRGYIAQHPRR
ncbi:MAG: SDR family oxidoreductase [Paracoccaceae bacterium]